MAKYHVTEQGSKLCRASKRPCPIGGVHYDGEEDANNAYLRESSGKILDKSIIKKSKSVDDLSILTRDALAHDLSYNGNPSEWLNKSNIYGKIGVSEPEIIDRVVLPDGRNVAVMWEDVSIAPTDIAALEKGIKISKLSYKDWNNGEEIGYLRTSVINEESYERAFGNDEFTPFRAYDEWESDSFELKDYAVEDNDNNYVINQYYPLNYSKTNLSNYDVNSLKLSILEKYHNNYNLPKINKNKTVDEQFKEAAINISDRMKDKTIYHETCFVDYSYMSDGYRGQGLGSSLYICR